ncbi:MAG TPA: hypothetical protein VFR34_06785 [Paracoccaceae bacterium]|nr:hypothetical protein [Paracoccaceae bacterium]
MDRTELALLVAAALLGAASLGALAAWAVMRLHSRAAPGSDEAAPLAARLRAAEAERDAAVRALGEQRSRSAHEIAACRAELAATLDRLAEARREAADLRHALATPPPERPGEGS